MEDDEINDLIDNETYISDLTLTRPGRCEDPKVERWGYNYIRTVSPLEGAPWT